MPPYANLSPQMIANRINKSADSLGVPRQDLQLLFRLQELLRQISESKYRSDFVFKGGFEIMTLIGAPLRTTTDLDVTLNHYSLNADELKKIFFDIFEHAEGPIHFEITQVKSEMNENKYPGFRLGVIGTMGKTRSKLNIDISTGDVIYPNPIKFMHTNFIDAHDKITINAFPQEQIMADKLITIYQKGPNNTRAKDFYDIWALSTLISNDLDHQHLIKAFHETAKAKKIGNLTLSQGEAILEELKTAPGMALSWKSYQQTKKFAQDIRLTRVLDSARKQLTQIFSTPQTKK